MGSVGYESSSNSELKRILFIAHSTQDDSKPTTIDLSIPVGCFSGGVEQQRHKLHRPGFRRRKPATIFRVPTRNLSSWYDMGYSNYNPIVPVQTSHSSNSCEKRGGGGGGGKLIAFYCLYFVFFFLDIDNNLNILLPDVGSSQSVHKWCCFAGRFNA